MFEYITYNAICGVVADGSRIGQQLVFFFIPASAYLQLQRQHSHMPSARLTEVSRTKPYG